MVEGSTSLILLSTRTPRLTPVYLPGMEHTTMSDPTIDAAHPGPPSLSEETCATLDAIIVHETLDYFLVEITSIRARALIDEREGFLERLLALTPPDTSGVRRPSRAQSKATSELRPIGERASFVEACAMEVPGALANAFEQRPSTNTWHPESSAKEVSTDEFARVEQSRKKLLERMRREQR